VIGDQQSADRQQVFDLLVARAVDRRGIEMDAVLAADTDRRSRR
jgi:hypothetical protein